MAVLSPLTAPADDTALVGQVLTLDGRPLAKVTFRIGSISSRSDETGRFLLTHLSSGDAVLNVDGRTASTTEVSYGTYAIAVRILEGGTNVLPFRIWMTPLDMDYSVAIAAPTSHDVVLTTPKVPGLEVRIPAGTTIRDINGDIATHVGITAIPMDRPPYPMPEVAFPLYYTIQPGGARLSPYGAQVVYPNVTGLRPGRTVHYWYYHPDQRGWTQAGNGVVSEDGRQIMPDESSYLRSFDGVSFTDPTRDPPPVWSPPNHDSPTPEHEGPSGNPPPPEEEHPTPTGNLLPIRPNDYDGEPVNLFTGLFILRATDLRLTDVMPIELTRIYRPDDLELRPFGLGTTHTFEVFPQWIVRFEKGELVLPDGGRIEYVRFSGSGFGSRLEHRSTQTQFFASVVAFDDLRERWVLTFVDGTAYEFGEGGPLQAIRDRYGNKISLLRRDSAGIPHRFGQVAVIRSPHGRWIELTYDAQTRVTSAVDNLGRVVRYEYDGIGRLVAVRNAAGLLTEYVYDAAHRLTEIHEAGALALRNEYDGDGRVRRQTGLDGHGMEFEYTTDAEGAVTETQVTDATGRMRRVRFDSNGHIVSDTRAVGTPVESGRTYVLIDGSSLIESSTDALGRRTRYEYDDAGRMTRLTRLDGTTEAVSISMTYDPMSHELAGIGDGIGPMLSSFEYDPRGALASVVDATGRRMTFEHDGSGQVTRVRDSLGHETTFTYAHGDMVAARNALGATITRVTDAAGRIVSVADARGATTQYRYDALNRVSSVTDALGGVSSFTYDERGRLTTIEDPLGAVTTHVFDEHALISRADPLGRTERYEYDDAGSLTAFTDRKGQRTEFSYDALRRLTGMADADGRATTYRFDGGDRVIEIADSASGTIQRSFDGFDRLLTEATTSGNVAYTYDRRGRRRTMVVDGGLPVTYEYDQSDRILAIAQGETTFSFQYDAAGHVSAVLAGAAGSEYVRDAASRITRVTYRTGGTLIGDLAYTDDAMGKRLEARGSFSRTAVPGAVEALTYDVASQLAAVNGEPTPHDENGNLLFDGIATYRWNARDQLASVERPSSRAEFLYDGLGRRIAVTVDGTTTDVLYDGLQLLEEAKGGARIRYLSALGLDDILARTTEGVVEFVLRDPVGSVVALTQNGLPSIEYTYEPYGRAAPSEPDHPNRVQFAGRENDGLDLVFMRGRYYSPRLCRFLSEDPIRLSGGSLNFYAYVGCDPVNRTDPMGLCETGEDIAAAVSDLNKSNWDTYYWVIGMAGVGVGVGVGVRGIDIPIAAWELIRDPFLEGNGRHIPKSLRNKILDRARRMGATGPLDIAHHNGHVITPPGAPNKLYAQSRYLNRCEGSKWARTAAWRRANTAICAIWGLFVRK